jgi:hypothetical protein
MRAFGELHLLFGTKTLINVTSKVGYQGKLDDLMNIFSKELKMSILYIICLLKSLRAIDPFDFCKKQFNCTKSSKYVCGQSSAHSKWLLNVRFHNMKSWAAVRMPLCRGDSITESIIAK